MTVPPAKSPQRTDLVVTSRIRVPHTEFDFSFVRSSGPGGQNVNKVNSKAVLRWEAAASPSVPADVLERFLKRYASRLSDDGGLVITSQRYRDQGRNAADCLEKLRAMLAAVVVAPKRRRTTQPTRGAVEKRLTHKRRQSERKQLRGSPRCED